MANIDEGHATPLVRHLRFRFQITSRRLRRVFFAADYFAFDIALMPLHFAAVPPLRRYFSLFTLACSRALSAQVFQHFAPL